jgi:hypothetical protein
MPAGAPTLWPDSAINDTPSECGFNGTRPHICVASQSTGTGATRSATSATGESVPISFWAPMQTTSRVSTRSRSTKSWGARRPRVSGTTRSTTAPATANAPSTAACSTAVETT